MKLNICTDKYTTEEHVNGVKCDLWCDDVNETQRWIFQDIADIENTINAMSDMKRLFNQSIGDWLKEYAVRERKMLQEKQIPWTTYAGFCLHKKDIYISISQMKYEIKQMYDVADADIINWLYENKQEHHIITQ